MFAGVECRGAADAAYTTALMLEYCKLTNTPYSGDAADILKCFDQIQWPLPYKIFEKAGANEDLGAVQAVPGGYMRA